MVKCLVNAALLFLGYSCVQAGPYLWRPRPVARPLVDAAQWRVHHQLLLTEQQVLQQSLDVGRLAQRTTADAYHWHRRAIIKIGGLARSLMKEARAMKAQEPKCVDDKQLKKALMYFSNATDEMFRCTHGLGDSAAGFEVTMTERVTATRAQVWHVQQAMWFCQAFTDTVDEECLRRLVSEGLEAVGKLPEKARMVVDRAAAERASASARLAGCAARVLSAALERRYDEAHAIRDCVGRTRGEGGLGAGGPVDKLVR